MKKFHHCRTFFAKEVTKMYRSASKQHTKSYYCIEDGHYAVIGHLFGGNTHIKTAPQNVQGLSQCPQVPAVVPAARYVPTISSAHDLHGFSYSSTKLDGFRLK